MHPLRKQTDAETRTSLYFYYLPITKFWEVFPYLPLSEELFSGDQIWLDGKTALHSPAD